MALPHMRRREGDEIYCPRCRKRWALDEDPGDCVDDQRKPVKVSTRYPY